jgi:hypothetical protein
MVTPTVPSGPPFKGGEQWIVTVRDASVQIVSPMKDGGFLVLGHRGEPGNDYPHWLLKLKEDGTIDWQQRFNSMFAFGVAETGNGGVLIVGPDSIVRLHPDGTLDWKKEYYRPLEQIGRPAFGIVQTIRPASNNGTLVIDQTSTVSTLDQNGSPVSQVLYPSVFFMDERVGWASPEGVLYGEQISNREYKITRWSPISLSWEMTFSFSSFDVPVYEPHFIMATRDGDALFGAPVRHLLGYPAFAHWIVRIDREGQVLWNTVLQGLSDWNFEVHEASDDSFIIATTSELHGEGGYRYDLRLLKLNASGNLVWERLFGDGKRAVRIGSIVDSVDGGFLLAGTVGQIGDRFSIEDGELILLKLDRHGKIPGCDWMRETPFDPPERKSPTHTIRIIESPGIEIGELIEAEEVLFPFESVEAHAALQAECVFPEVPIPTPTSLPTPSPAPTQVGQIYPIIGGDGIVLGGVLDGLWVDSSTTETILVEHETYRVFLNGLAYLGTAAASSYLSASDEPCVGSLKLGWEPTIQPEALALSGTWDPLPRLPAPLSPDLPVYQDALTELLRANGISDPDGHLTALKRIDLDGDGADEVVMSAAWLENGLESTSVAEGDYALVVVRKLVGDEVVTIPLRADFYPSAESDVLPVIYKIAAVMDLNADGDMEIVLDTISALGTQTTIYEVSGESIRQALHVPCRALPPGP